MPYKDYIFLEELKPGGTSRVHVVRDQETEEKRIMKITTFRKIKRQIWQNEIHALQRFQYVRGIVKMYEFGEFQDQAKEDFGYVVLEHCDNDLLESPIQSNEIYSVFLFLYHTLTTIHALGYCYCDLKLENVLRMGKGYRLCDFSSCQPIGTMNNILFGTPHLLAPELLQCVDQKSTYFYDEKIDTWGLGCLMLEMVLHEAFDRHHIQNQLNEVENPLYHKLIQICTQTNPQTRIRLWELSQHVNFQTLTSSPSLIPPSPTSVSLLNDLKKDYPQMLLQPSSTFDLRPSSTSDSRHVDNQTHPRPHPHSPSHSHPTPHLHPNLLLHPLPSHSHSHSHPDGSSVVSLVSSQHRLPKDRSHRQHQRQHSGQNNHPHPVPAAAAPAPPPHLPHHPPHHPLDHPAIQKIVQKRRYLRSTPLPSLDTQRPRRKLVLGRR